MATENRQTATIQSGDLVKCYGKGQTVANIRTSETLSYHMKFIQFPSGRLVSIDSYDMTDLYQKVWLFARHLHKLRFSRLPQ